MMTHHRDDSRHDENAGHSHRPAPELQSAFKSRDGKERKQRERKVKRKGRGKGGESARSETGTDAVVDTDDTTSEMITPEPSPARVSHADSEYATYCFCQPSLRG
jgi:hypothetical protein